LLLIEKLRRELEHYGEMLALLERQQESVVARASDDVLNSVVSINEQMARIQGARQDRESCQQEIARHLQKSEEPAFATLIPLLPEKFQVPIEALVRENNELLSRIQRRARQNHLLLTRSLQMMQQFMNALIPASAPTTYNGEGNLQTSNKPAQLLYEAIG
jgi:flagellar biosynthesis/type III secretory pathway chaperone